MHVSMQKIQILFPDPVMERLRRLAQVEDRPVSEIVRRAVDREVEQRSALLALEANARKPFPVFDGGRVLASASEMKALIHE